MTSDILKRAAEAVEGVTPGPWTVWEEKTATADDAKAELASQVDDTDGFCGAVFMLNAFGKCPALTGCGPTSKANAHFIAAARTLIPDMAAAIAERDEQIERLTARAEAAEAQVANAGAVMVEACAREADAHYAAGDMGNPGHHIRALSTLSPIAAAAGVLQVNTPNPVFDLLKPVLMGEVSEAVTYLDADGNEYSDRRMVSWDAMKDVLRLAFRALAEQEKADE